MVLGTWSMMSCFDRGWACGTAVAVDGMNVLDGIEDESSDIGGALQDSADASSWGILEFWAGTVLAAVEVAGAVERIAGVSFERLDASLGYLIEPGPTASSPEATRDAVGAVGLSIGRSDVALDIIGGSVDAVRASCDSNEDSTTGRSVATIGASFGSEAVATGFTKDLDTAVGAPVDAIRVPMNGLRPLTAAGSIGWTGFDIFKDSIQATRSLTDIGGGEPWTASTSPPANAALPAVAGASIDWCELAVVCRPVVVCAGFVVIFGSQSVVSIVSVIRSRRAAIDSI